MIRRGWLWGEDFNPLHREGGDRTADQKEKYAKISIHSTARVETHSAILVPRPFYKFQSTPPRGWRRFRGRP